MSNFQIVDENMSNRKKKKMKKTIIISISAMLFIALCIGIYFLVNRKPKDYKVYEEKAKIYSEHSIQYTYDDYKKDEKAIAESNNEQQRIDKEEKDENKQDDQNDSNKEIKNNIASNEHVSEATKKLINKNEQTLNEVKKDTMIDTTTPAIINSIYQQTKIMNGFINNHCGYPDKEWGEEYDRAKQFIDDVVNSMSGKSNFEPLYGMTIPDTQAEVRYSIFEGVQYNVGNNYTKYRQCLLNWMSYGHPEIKNIETISLVKSDNKLFDGMYMNNLNAVLISNGVKYRVYLSSYIMDGKEPLYKILDIEKI